MAINRPKNYKEVLRYKRCRQLQGYFPAINEEYLERIYHFIAVPNQTVTVSQGVLSLRDANNAPVDTLFVGGSVFSYVLLSDHILHTTTPGSSSDTVDGGSSGNNNNNNNNNS